MYCNVFKIVPQVNYAYGIALVAACTKNEAISTFCSDDYNEHQYNEFSCSCEMIPAMNYETAKPQVILNCIKDE